MSRAMKLVKLLRAEVVELRSTLKDKEASNLDLQHRVKELSDIANKVNSLIHTSMMYDKYDNDGLVKRMLQSTDTYGDLADVLRLLYSDVTKYNAMTTNEKKQEIRELIKANSKLTEENQELLEYKAKYFNVVRLLEIE